jgi:hypothetical protein
LAGFKNSRTFFGEFGGVNHSHCQVPGGQKPEVPASVGADQTTGDTVRSEEHAAERLAATFKAGIEP